MPGTRHRYLWYLCQPLVILSLFDKEVPDVEEADIAAHLLASPRPAVYEAKKPTFPVRTLVECEATLSTFVGSGSWMLFDLLHMNPGWLNEAPDHWGDNADLRWLLLPVISQL